MAADPPLRDSAAFHCQQAVEKLLKDFLTLAGKRSRRTHSLEQLRTLAQQSFPDIAELVASATGWSDWRFEFRYPHEDAPPEPEEAELGAALALIDELTRCLRSVNPPSRRPMKRKAILDGILRLFAS
jgi:HEPN domain-containing protein